MKKNKQTYSIQIVNIEQGYPTLSQAKTKLKNLINTNNHKGYQKERIIKIIHGYGSSAAGGGVLQNGLRSYLEESIKANLIKGYIRGEDFGNVSVIGMNLISEYPSIVSDRDFNQGNPGITIVTFRK